MIWLMPFLPFEAIDSSGKTVRGTLQADSVQQLELILMQKGLRVVSLGVQPPAAPRPTPKPAQAVPKLQANPQSRPQQQSRPISREVPVPQKLNQSLVASSTTTVKTPELTNKQTFLLFTQFASFARSGFSSSQMIHHATSKMPPKIHSAFAEMEQETAGGMTLSDSMARRPILFPPDQVATVKAGEQSGHMEEAFNVVALQAERANAFRLSLLYFFIVFPVLIVCGVGGIGLQKASASTIQKQFDADGQLDRVGTLLGEVRGRLLHEFLLAILIAIGFIIAVKLLHKYPFRKFRHRAGLMLPIGLGRARAEAVERFSWSMSTMLKGGASPASAIHIAAASIPNLTLREQTLNAVGSARENEQLASMLQRSGLMTPEYVHIVQNGEIVGDAPGALNTIAKAEGDNFQRKTGGLKVVVSASTLAIMGLFTIIMVGFLYYMYASNMVRMLNNVQ